MSDSESIKNRVLMFMKSIGSNPNRFQESIGVSGTYLKTVKSIGADKISKILDRYPEVNPEWLLTGRGEMLKSTPENNSRNVHNAGKISVEVPAGDYSAPKYDKDQQILILENEVKHLNMLLAEKERFIQVLLKK